MCVDCGLLPEKACCTDNPGHHDSSVLRAFRTPLVNPCGYQSHLTTGS